MGKYWCLFYDLPGLLSRNPQLQSDYQAFVKNDISPVLARAFSEFASIGFLSVKLGEIQPLATTAWLIVKFWFTFQQTVRPDIPLTEETGKQGVRQVLALLKPYVQPEYATTFEKIEARYRPS